MNIRILRAANRDLVEGYEFYEKQTRGLGNHFLDSLFSDIDSLLITAGVHPVFFHRYYRLLSRRFPFTISPLQPIRQPDCACVATSYVL